MAQDRDTQPHWYVAHTYSGYENKVRQDLETIVENRRLQDLIQEVRVPTETVVEMCIRDRGADAFLCEATLTGGSGAEQGHHLSAAAAGLLAAKHHAKRLLLTHYHEDRAQDVLRQAREFFSAAELTHIGTTYAI